ncbi:hypothetical protein [Spirosoma endbachense]|nr:hypothetical protein [Spirosoma endbachense]
MKKFSVFKRSNFLQLPLFLIMVLLISCNKENTLRLPNRGTSFSVKEAETWYNSQFKSKTSLFTTLEPEWSGALFKKSSDDKDFLIVPFKGSVNFNVKGSSVQSQQLHLRIFKDELSKKFQGRIVQFTSKLAAGDWSSYTITDSFSGRVFFRSINDGKLLFGYRYDKGKVTFQINPTSANAKPAGEVCNCRMQYYFTCYCQKPGTQSGLADVAVVGTSYTNDCNANPPTSNDVGTPWITQEGYRCGHWENNGAEMYNECYWVQDPVSGDPGTGGSADVDNQVTKPCVRSQVNGIINANVKNYVQTTFNEVFNNTKGLNMMIFQEDNGLGKAARTEVTSTNPLTIIMHVNANFLADASKEYATMTIYHELFMVF